MSEIALPPTGVTRPHSASAGVPAVRLLARLMTIVVAAAVLLAICNTVGIVAAPFATWRTVAIIVLIWFVIIDANVFLNGGTKGQQALFLLPALQITLALVIFPLLFGVAVSFTQWDIGGITGPVFNGLDNFRYLANDQKFWNAIGNNFKFVLVAVPLQYIIAFGIALLLNQQVRGLKFFRVVFLLPFMISPVAVGWMVGRSILDANRGVVPRVLDGFGIEKVSFFDQKLPAFLGIVAMDSWIAVPFMMVMLLAGLQALPTEIFEAAQIDGSSGWQRFWDITFPLMLPVSLTAIVLRVIFEFKLVDLVRIVTAGGPGGSTDTVSLYIYREGVESGNVGYATTMAMVFLVIVLISVTALLVIGTRRVRDVVY
ncbi:MAG: sugar ABC transporter permease [Thermomicrobiales bacterium]